MISPLNLTDVAAGGKDKAAFDAGDNFNALITKVAEVAGVSVNKLGKGSIDLAAIMKDNAKLKALEDAGVKKDQLDVLAAIAKNGGTKYSGVLSTYDFSKITSEQVASLNTSFATFVDSAKNSHTTAITSAYLDTLAGMETTQDKAKEWKSGAAVLSSDLPSIRTSLGRDGAAYDNVFAAEKKYANFAELDAEIKKVDDAEAVKEKAAKEAADAAEAAKPKAEPAAKPAEVKTETKDVQLITEKGLAALFKATSINSKQSGFLKEAITLGFAKDDKSLVQMLKDANILVNRTYKTESGDRSDYVADLDKVAEFLTAYMVKNTKTKNIGGKQVLSDVDYVDNDDAAKLFDINRDGTGDKLTAAEIIKGIDVYAVAKDDHMKKLAKLMTGTPDTLAATQKELRAGYLVTEKTEVAKAKSEAAPVKEVAANGEGPKGRKHNTGAANPQ